MRPLAILIEWHDDADEETKRAKTHEWAALIAAAGLPYGVTSARVADPRAIADMYSHDDGGPS